MHPRANPRREQREGRSKSISGRTQEIQRLIGRALRSAIVLEKLGERQLTIDCDILEADGGTRTASVTGGFVAMLLAIDKLTKEGAITQPCVRAQVASVSVGMVAGEMLLDLVYVEDSRAQMDLNLAATSNEQIIEVQGTAEGAPIARGAFDSMVDLAMQGVQFLCGEQKKALQAAGVDVERLLVKD
jgi:ribonuclease PH